MQAPCHTRHWPRVSFPPSCVCPRGRLNCCTPLASCQFSASVVTVLVAVSTCCRHRAVHATGFVPVSPRLCLSPRQAPHFHTTGVVPVSLPVVSVPAAGATVARNWPRVSLPPVVSVLAAVSACSTWPRAFPRGCRPCVDHRHLLASGQLPSPVVAAFAPPCSWHRAAHPQWLHVPCSPPARRWLHVGSFPARWLQRHRAPADPQPHSQATMVIHSLWCATHCMGINKRLNTLACCRFQS